MKNRNKILDLLQEKFRWSLSTAQIWLSAPNYLLESSSPEEMIKLGQTERVLYIINSTRRSYATKEIKLEESVKRKYQEGN